MVPEAPFPCRSHPAPAARVGMLEMQEAGEGAGKGKREGKRLKMVHMSPRYGITTVWLGTGTVYSLVIEGFFLLKQKFSQSLPELLEIFSPSVALPCNMGCWISNH